MELSSKRGDKGTADMFTVEMLPAGHGDALLVEYGSPSVAHRVLIDGGPWSSYPHLRARIEALPPEDRHFALLVVTHVDSDHIDGVVKLLGDAALGVTFGDVWFNAYEHMSAERTLAPKHGEMLSSLIRARRLPWNAAFGEGPVVIPETGPLPSVPLPGGAQCTILSPAPLGLSRMRTVWDREIRKAGLVPGEAGTGVKLLEENKRFSPLDQTLGAPKVDLKSLLREPFDSDASAANGSSIAFLLEYGGHSCVFGADASPTTLAAGARRLVESRVTTTLRVDAFKLPHHGSRNNVSVEMLRLLPSHRYLFSTNGTHFGHPDRAAVARVLTLGPANATLRFNYRTRWNDVWDDGELMENCQYGVRFPDDGKAGLRVDLESGSRGDE